MTRPWTVYSGDCRVVLRDMDPESIDACVTDTPYGLSTLLDPPNLDREALWQKLVSGEKAAPIETLMRSWLDTGENPAVKGRGFMGKEWDALVPPPNTWREVWRVLKPGAYCLAFGGTRTYALIEMSLRFADFEVEDHVCWLQGQGMAKRVRLSLKIDEHFEDKGARRARFAEMKRLKRSVPPPRRDEGLPFEGHDRALAPKWEPVIVACKPLRGTIAENALAHGTGGLHVDACRLSRGDAGKTTGGVRHGSDRSSYGAMASDMTHNTVVPFINARGGYPANVAMDDETAVLLDEMGGERKSGGTPKWRNGIGYASGAVGGPSDQRHDASTGGASRFFFTAKASSSERDAGLEDLSPLTAGERCDRENGSAGVNGYAGTRGDGGRNPHPTVKPVALMRWLCRLASPPGAHDPDISKRPVILDPFFGSGSTGVAALQEGVRVVGVELDEKMADVARRRLHHAYALPRDDEQVPAETGVAVQRSLF